MGNSHLVKVVQALTDTLDRTSLGSVSAHGGAGGSGSVQKGKERADMEGSLGKSDKDGEGDADDDKGGSEGGEEDD